MSSVVVDPVELRRFEASLRELTREVRARRINLEKETSDVSSFWNDERYRRFVKEQETLMLQIQIFERLSEQYSDFLRRKAAAADDLLRR